MIELLLGAQLLFLNNFSEPLCKQAKTVLKAVFENLTVENQILIVGKKENGRDYNLQEREDGLADQIKLNVVLFCCAILYNFELLAIELFNEEPRHFQTFCYLVRTVLPSDLQSLSKNGLVPHMSPYEVKLIVCGLSRAFFGRANSVDVPVELSKNPSSPTLK